MMSMMYNKTIFWWFKLQEPRGWYGIYNPLSGLLLL